MGRRKRIDTYDEILADGHDAVTVSYYLQECLHEQVSQIAAQFDEYLKTSPDELDLVEMRDKLKKLNKSVLERRKDFEDAGWNYDSKLEDNKLQARYLYYRQELIYRALAAKNTMAEIKRNILLDEMDDDGGWDDE